MNIYINTSKFLGALSVFAVFFLFVVSQAMAVDDPLLSEQWYITKIHADDAWAAGFIGSSDVRIAIADTGVDATHEDLDSKVLAQLDHGGIGDEDGHGTAVAGIAAAVTDNAKGIAGVGYDSSLLDAKVTWTSVVVYPSDVYDTVVWAADHSAKVINMSFGDYSSSLDQNDIEQYENAMQYAQDHGILVVAAVGNANVQIEPTDFYPAGLSESYNNVISVGGTDENDNRWVSGSSGSNWGSWIDVAAPAHQIKTTVPGSLYTLGNGTSFAAPQVSGLAALIIAQHPNWTPAQIISRIKATTDTIPGSGTDVESGRINVCKALGCPTYEGMLGHWEMNESSWNGTTDEIVDSSGLNNHGTAKYGATLLTGSGGNNMGAFDGVDDYVSAPIDNTSYFTGIQDLTLAAWIKRSGTGDYGSVIAKTSLGVSNYPTDFDLGVGADDKVFFKADGLTPTAYTSTGTITDNAWHHVAVVKSGSTLTFYIDGSSAGSGSISSGYITNSASEIDLGTDKAIYDDPSAYFGGIIDDARIYNQALSATDMSWLASFTPPNPTSSIVRAYAAGTPDGSGNKPNLRLYIDNLMKINVTNGVPDTMTEYTYVSPTRLTGQEAYKVQLPNWTAGKKLQVDKISVDGLLYESESINTEGSNVQDPSGNCNTNRQETEFIICSYGYFLYNQPAGTVLHAYAAGKDYNGTYPTMDVIVDGFPLLTYKDVKGDPDGEEYIKYNFVATDSAAFEAKNVKLRFFNDTTPNPSSRDLRIDKITVSHNGGAEVPYESEDIKTKGVGAQDPTGECANGRQKTDWLRCNGYFLYDQPYGEEMLVYAAGTSDGGIYPDMSIKVNGIIYQMYKQVKGNPSTGNYIEYNLVTDPGVSLVGKTIQVLSTGNTLTRNFGVDKLTWNGNDYDAATSTTWEYGVWNGSTCTQGNLGVKLLTCPTADWFTFAPFPQ